MKNLLVFVPSSDQVSFLWLILTFFFNFNIIFFILGLKQFYNAPGFLYVSVAFWTLESYHFHQIWEISGYFFKYPFSPLPLGSQTMHARVCWHWPTAPWRPLPLGCLTLDCLSCSFFKPLGLPSAAWKLLSFTHLGCLISLVYGLIEGYSLYLLRVCFNDPISAWMCGVWVQ